LFYFTNQCHISKLASSAALTSAAVFCHDNQNGNKTCVQKVREENILLAL